MSDSVENNNTNEVIEHNSVTNETPAQGEINEDSQEELSKEALLAASFKKDMFKFKQQAKAMKIELDALKEEKAAAERAALEKNQEWKILYEKEREAKAKLANELTEKSTKFITSSKVNAVVQKLGGFKKDSYSKFINHDNILTDPDTGAIIEDSLIAEADRIKQEYPELLKGYKPAPIPDAAPKHAAPDNGKVDIRKMSKDELLRFYSTINKK